MVAPHYVTSTIVTLTSSEVQGNDNGPISSFNWLFTRTVSSITSSERRTGKNLRFWEPKTGLKLGDRVYTTNYTFEPATLDESSQNVVVRSVVEN